MANPQPALRLDDETRNKVAEEQALGMSPDQSAVLHDLSPAPLRKLLRQGDMKTRVKAQLQRIRGVKHVEMIREQLLLPDAIDRLGQCIRNEDDAEGLRTAKWLVERHLPSSAPAPEQNINLAVDVDVDGGLRLLKDVLDLKNATPTEDRPLLEGEAALPKAALEEMPK